MAKIFDCFPFFNELDTIEIRMKELYDSVDHFVIAEATKTHSGQAKPLYFQENKDRFKAFQDKILHIIVRNMPESPENNHDINWTRERFQRNAIGKELHKRCQKDDLIISTDADEVTKSSKIKEILEKATHGKICNIEMNTFNYYLNLRGNANWYSGKAFRYSTYKENYASNASNIRVSGTNVGVKDAGWHFGYMGGLNKVQDKLKSFAHQEFNTSKFTNLKHLKINISTGTSIWDMRDQMDPVGSVPFWRFIEVNENANLPACVIKEKERYKNLIADAYFSEYLYDIGNLNRLKMLCDSVKDLNGQIIDVGACEGRVTTQLAAIADPQKVIAVDWWRQPERLDRFRRNIASLTAGNVEIKQEEAISFLKGFGDKIKFIQIDFNYEYGLLRDCLDAAIPKMTTGGIICGYDYKNDHARNAVTDMLGAVESSGSLWYKKI